MRRRLAAIFAMVALATSLAAGPVAADDPELRGFPPRARSGDPSTKGGQDRDTQAAPGANGRIVFARSPFNGLPNGLWSMTSGGSDQQQLTPGGSGIGDVEPSYSPGGSMVVFARDMTADEDDFVGDIFVMQADGTGVKRLTATSTSDEDPDWTPDGSRIVFTSLRTGNGDIYSMKIDGSDLRRLTNSTAYDGYPTVSPDGKKVAFASGRTGNYEIHSMNIDGTGVARLTNGPDDDLQSDWSPDGTMIAFWSLMSSEPDIYVMNADGSNVVGLTNAPSSSDLEPTWSPDGTQIAFWSYADADTDIYTMPATGGATTPIGATGADEWGADWQPVPEFPLVDARFSTFKADIEWVFGEGITVGCSAERYCPADAVTRGQMATFLVRALDLPATSTDYFSDDNGTTHEQNINRVREANITVGCAPGKYCPNDVVTRGQMASFLARAFALPTTATDYFTDDNGTTHESNINRLAFSGITTGCTPTTYCPGADVTRGQMAAFLRRALE